MKVSVPQWRGMFLAMGLIALGSSLPSAAQIGELDHSFAAHGVARFSCGASSYGNKDPNIKVYPASSETHAGKIVVAGSWWDYNSPKNGAPSFAVARYLPDGSADAGFGTNGVAVVAVQSTKQDYCNDVAIQSDDKIVLVGRSNNNLGIARLTAAGVLDTTFSGDGLLTYTPSNYSYSWAYSVAVQKDGKIVVGGHGNNGPESWFILRLNDDGSEADLQYYDFQPSNRSEHMNRLILDDGPPGAQKIYATGSVHDGTNWLLCTLKVDENLTEAWRKIENPSVNGGAGYGLTLRDFGGDSAPEVVVAGEGIDGSYSPGALAVVYSDGVSEATRYAAFGDGGAYLLPASSGGFTSKNAVVDGNGKLILAGSNSNGGLVFTRINANGTVDTSFGDNGCKVYVGLALNSTDFVLDSSDKILSVGESYPDMNGTYTDFGLMRLLTVDQSMTFITAPIQQKTSNISPGVTRELLQIIVCVNGAENPLHVTSFSFDTAGSTAPGTDITSAKLFFTGNEPHYYQQGLFGSANGPNGVFTITGSQVLSHGDNYFWLAYSVPETAALGNVLDAVCSTITIGGAGKTPLPTAPAGSRTIASPAYTEISGFTDWGDYITNVSISTIESDTGANVNGYEDHTADCSPELEGGHTYTLSCTIAGTFPTFQSHVKAWFDWNHNYDFSDPGEEYTIVSGALSTGPHTADITVPANVAAECTRFRMALRCDGKNSPPYFEDVIDYGEAEDYSFTGVVTSAAPVITQGTGPLSVTMSEDGVPTAWSAPTLGATDDNGDTLTWSVSSAASHGTAAVSGTGGAPTAFTYSPDAHWNGTDSFTVQVSDGALTDTIVVEVIVQAVNDAPMITGQAALSTPEDTALTITLADLTVTDVDNTYPTGFSLSVGDGMNYTRTGNTITPSLNFTGTLTVPATVSDGSATSGSYNLSVTVSAVNDAPLLSGIGNKSVREGETLAFTISATDVENNGLTYSATNLPEGAALHPDTGAFSWTPGLKTASTYNGVEFIVMDNGTPAGSDSEVISITVEPMTITLSSPNGGETWKRTTTHAITWTCSADIAPEVKLRLLKGGTFVRFLSGSLENTGSWNWTIPEDLPIGVDYQIVAYTPDYAYSDISNGMFAIADAPLRLIAPNGGETWKHRTAHEITWHGDPEIGAHVKLRLMKGGSFLQFLTGNVSNDGAWTWSVPDTLAVGNDYRIMVYTPDYGYTDVSDTAFSIAAAPLRLVSPNGGEVWKRNTKHAITWQGDTETGDSVKFQLLKGGAFVQFLSGEVENDGRWDWIIPTDLAIGDDYTIMVYTPDYAYRDFSDAAFSIAAAPLRPSAPAADAVWKQRTTRTVTWASDLEVGAEVKFKLYKGGAFVSFLSGVVSNTGAWQWTISSALPFGDDYAIQIYTPDYAYSAYTSAFSIAAPPLRITRPNSGETLVLGATEPITWEADPETGEYVKFKLFKGNAFVLYMSGQVPNNGTLNWKAPAGLTPGDDYWLQIYTPDYAYTNYSAGMFRLTEP